MVAEGDFEMAMEDEQSELGTEAGTDDEIYELETEEETDKSESEAEAEAEAKETAKDEICGFVSSKPKQLKAQVMSRHGVKIDTSGQIDKLIEKKNPEDCEILESKLKNSRKAEKNGSKPRDIRRYGCQICGIIRAKRKRLKVHIMLNHGVEIDIAEIDKLIEKKNPEDCEILESKLKNSRKAESNGSKPRDIRRYRCQICGIIRAKRKRLKVHIMLNHGVEIDIAEIDKLIEKKNREDCEILDSKLKKSRKAESNGAKPRDIRRYRCQICGIIRAKRKRLKVHIMMHHGAEIDIAEMDKLIEKKNPEDGEILEAEAKMSRRVENNGFKLRELRSYRCTLCGLVRSKRKYLENHIKLEHTGEMDTQAEMNKFIEKRRSEDDQRRYSCQICGVLRSKRSLLKFHMISSHGPEALKSDKRFASEGTGKHSECFCNICGMSFGKPSHLQQHKLSHSALRSFVCPIVGCLCSYKRQDHLNRHLLKHEGELFVCPKEDCKLQLSTLSNLKRHLNRHRERGESWQSQSVKPKETKKRHMCPELYCDKAFKYPSKLAKHLEDVHSTTYTEIICCEPGCLKYFTNAEALNEHLRQAHNHICCEVCGSQQLKKQIKRHMRIHENRTCVKSIACPYERCLHSYTTKSNLRQHIKSVHLELKPFKCQFRECGMTFAHKSARDRHEMCGTHCYVQGDFLEEDAALQSRSRGGRKRKAFTIDSIFRKRIAGPDQSTILENGLPFMDWLMSDNAV